MFKINNAVVRASPATNTKKTSSASRFAGIVASLSPSAQAVRKIKVNPAIAQQAERTRLANEQAAAQRAATQQAERTRLANEQAATQQAEPIRLAAAQVAAQQAAAERTRLANEQATRQAAAQVAAQQAAAWTAMTKQQKILAVVDKIFLDPAAGANYRIPADLNRRVLIKNIFRDLMNDHTINVALINVPNAQPANFRILFPFITPHLGKAVKIHTYESAPYNMTRRDAKDCVAFAAHYDATFAEFPLDTEKKLVLYRALKANFRALPWADVMNVVTPILKNSLPLDYHEWPNFETNPGANFDNFIHHILTPAINAVRGEVDTEAAAEQYVQGLLRTRQQNLRADMAQKIAHYQTLNNEYIHRELTDHGRKIPLTSVSTINFADLTHQLSEKLMDLEEQEQNDPALRQRINYSYLCADPFLSLLRAPDARLTPLRENYNIDHTIEVQNLKTRVLTLIPAQDRILDQEFHQSFDTHPFSLGAFTDLNKETVIRLKRLYDCIRDNQGEGTAARVIYAFGAENSGRCIDGKRDRITELERQYVYVTGNQAVNRDLDSIIGLNLSKLFMDDRMDILRYTINFALYGAGEPQTYAWFRSHRALYLGFGLSGHYDEMMYGGGHREGVNPVEFVHKYFKGGNIRGYESARLFSVPAFTLDKMTDIVSQDIKKVRGGSFDDNTLNYMINSNLALRRAYAEFQENAGDTTFENNYFRDASVPQRQALKDDAIKEVLKNYNYIYQRNDVDNRWE